MREKGYKTDMGGKAECICAVSTEFLPLKFTQLITLILMKSRIEITSGKGGARRKRNMELRTKLYPRRQRVLTSSSGRADCTRGDWRPGSLTDFDQTSETAAAGNAFPSFSSTYIYIWRLETQLLCSPIDKTTVNCQHMPLLFITTSPLLTKYRNL